MQKAVQIIKLVLTLLPLLIDAIKAVEAVFPESGKGAVKLALVRDAVEAAYGPTLSAVATFEEAWPALEKTITSIVATFNATGLFDKKAA